MFLKTDDGIIFNTDQITKAHLVPSGTLVVFFGGEETDPVRLKGDEAKRIWRKLEGLCDDQGEDGERTINVV
jgi:hypothetical protein